MLVTRWILKSLTTRETRSRGAQSDREKSWGKEQKWFSTTFFKSPHNFLSQDLPVVFPLRFPPSITLRAPSVTLLAFRYPLAFQIETNGDEARTNNKLNAVADPGEGAGGPGGPDLPLIFRPKWGLKGSPPPPLCDGLDRPLQCHMWCEWCFPSLLRLNVWVFPFPQNWTCPISDRWAWLALVRFL